MSRFLVIESERVPEPSASEALERQTWAAVRIFAHERCVTRLLDRTTGKETDTIFIPLFPLARWMVFNWWSIINETCRWDFLPMPGQQWTPQQRAWVGRHSLRAAESGLLLPRLCLFGDGRHVCAEWIKDEDDAYPNMPGQFLYSSRVLLERVQVKAALEGFIAKTLSWLSNERDCRVQHLRENWEAIANADPAEIAFCEAAGRLGLDPYGSLEGSILDLLEQAGISPQEQPLFEDVLDAVEPAQSPELWKWASEVEHSLQLSPAPRLEVPPLPSTLRAAQAGYAMARRWRDQVGLAPGEPMQGVAGVGKKMGIDLGWEIRNHLAAGNVRAAVGWREGRKPVLVGPKPEQEPARRFLEARGLYHAAYACTAGPRLVTDARSWDQQCSRAFAAELLVPQEVVQTQIPDGLDPEETERQMAKIADRFQVSVYAVMHQLENGRRSY